MENLDIEMAYGYEISKFDKWATKDFIELDENVEDSFIVYLYDLGTELSAYCDCDGTVSFIGVKVRSGEYSLEFEDEHELLKAVKKAKHSLYDEMKKFEDKLTKEFLEFITYKTPRISIWINVEDWC